MSPQLPTVLLRAQTDERLSRLAALGSERAFEAIVERYRRPLLGYARRIAGESKAEDVVQAAFLAAWGRLSDGAEVRDLRAWLFRIVHNGAINAVKRASASDVELFDDTPALGDVHAEIERRDDVRRTLDGIAALPLQQREALLGVAVQGRRHRDVGADLGVTDGAVRMLLHRARTTMRTAATALTPWPLLAWLSGDRGAEVAAGGAGAGALAAGGLKAAALLSTAAIAVSAAPQLAPSPPSSPASGSGGAITAAASFGAGSLPGAPRESTSPTPKGDDERRPSTRRRHDAPAPDAGRGPAAAQRPRGPRPAAAAPAGPPAAPVVIERDETTALPQQDEKDDAFLRPAVGEDDEIAVDEEAPDLAAGERPIPAEGVPDAIAEAALPEAPAAAQDASELDAEEAAPASPQPAADPAAAASSAAETSAPAPAP
ncbi:MAG TPA: sigma-70 family RNA polymerase sigma factor [Solirubrobacteraceae bacterium]|nr:sigma-70 family RNA polymerase sigma factor [Solirubrobacteraceae bacterium]